MDQQDKTERSWKIPYKLSERLGGLSFDVLCSISENRLGEAFAKPYPIHRFSEKMSRYAFRAINRIGNVYEGNAALIWSDKPPSARVVYRFLEFDGIGPKIATMAANILARELKIPFSDYYSIDISIDVHVRRVFTRLRLVPEGATNEQLIYQARSLHPPFPGLMDYPAWEIGYKWCHPKNPQCHECYMQHLCWWAERNRREA